MSFCGIISVYNPHGYIVLSYIYYRMPEQLTRKNDLIIWLCMSNTQQQIYSDFLGLERVKEVTFCSLVLCSLGVANK